MTSNRFNEVFQDVIKNAETTLIQKAKEYATEDRLHNFKVAAEFLQCSEEQALFGFLTKHLVSLSDMVRTAEKGYPISTWDEKIGDTINYLILLRAVVQERLDWQYDVAE